MARGDGKAKKGRTRGKLPVKRMLLGGSVDGPAPSNASSMSSGYGGGSSGGNNFGAGGAGGLGGSSREGGFAGAGTGRLESPAQRTSPSIGQAKAADYGGIAAQARAANPNLSTEDINRLAFGSAQWGRVPFGQSIQGQALLEKAKNPLTYAQAQALKGKLPESVKYGWATSPVPAGYTGYPVTAAGYNISVNIPNSLRAPGIVPHAMPGISARAPSSTPVGGSVNSANRTGASAPPAAPAKTITERAPQGSMKEYTDRLPGMTGATQAPQYASAQQPAAPAVAAPAKPATTPSPGFAGTPPSDRGSARGEGNRPKKRPRKKDSEMASGGLVRRGDGKSRVKTKGRMV